MDSSTATVQAIAPSFPSRAVPAPGMVKFRVEKDATDATLGREIVSGQGSSTSALQALGLGNSLWWGSVLGIVGHLAAPLASTH